MRLEVCGGVRCSLPLRRKRDPGGLDVDSVRRAKPTMADAGASECWMGAGDYDDGGGGWMGSWVWDRAVEYSGYGCGRRATRQGLSVQVGYFENSGRVCGPGPCPREAPPDLARSGEDAQWERGLRAVSGAARPINAFARREVEPAGQPASQIELHLGAAAGLAQLGRAKFTHSGSTCALAISHPFLRVATQPPPPPPLLSLSLRSQCSGAGFGS